jgi:dUTP pyrophosphatase
MFKPIIKFLKIHEDAHIPKKAHKSDAGMDLYAIQEDELLPGEFKVIKIGLKMSLPFGYEAQVRPRSGLAAKKGISVLNTPGTIDADYRGEVGVILINHSKEVFKIKKGDRIAQMIISKLDKFKIVETNDLTGTKRGSGGFGSTGFKQKKG